MCDHLALSNMFIIAVLCGYLWVVTFLKLHPTLRNQTEQNQKWIQAVGTTQKHSYAKKMGLFIWQA